MDKSVFEGYTLNALHPWDRVLFLLLTTASYSANVSRPPLAMSMKDPADARTLAIMLASLRDTTWMEPEQIVRNLASHRRTLHTLSMRSRHAGQHPGLLHLHESLLEIFAFVLDSGLLNAGLLDSRHLALADKIESVAALMSSYLEDESGLTDLVQQLLSQSSASTRAPFDWWKQAWAVSLGSSFFNTARTMTAADVGNPPGAETIHIYLDPGDASSDDIREVLAALNALHEAAGGRGFVFSVEGDRLVVSRVPQ